MTEDPKTVLDQIREKLRADYDVDANEEEFLMHYVEVNLLEVCRELQDSLDAEAWSDCEWIGQFVKSVAANFDLPELRQASDAILTCIEKRDAEKLALVARKLSRMVEAIVNGKAPAVSASAMES
mgnify:CR=1 FL=1